MTRSENEERRFSEILLILSKFGRLSKEEVAARKQSQKVYSNSMCIRLSIRVDEVEWVSVNGISCKTCFVSSAQTSHFTIRLVMAR
jgi:hypothetical protein